MDRRVAVVGDKLERGGEILPYDGSPCTWMGHQMALIGGQAFCAACQHIGVIAMAGGQHRLPLMGIQSALDLDIVLCACKTPPRIIAELSGDSWIDDDESEAVSMAPVIGEALAALRAASPAPVAVSSGNSPDEPAAGLVAGFFVGEETGTPAAAPAPIVTLAWEIQNNQFGDKLPVIPTESRVEHGKILYRLKIKATVHSSSQNGQIAGRTIEVKSNRGDDQVRVSGPTASDGSAIVTLETRKPGALQLSTSTPGITAAPLSINLQEAWYESGFHITHYIIADERDAPANDPMLQAPGVTGLHRRSFLYGAGRQGVPMQGTGITLNNRYVRYNGGGGGWHHNAAGNPDILNHPAGAHLSDTDGVHGRFADLVANRSIAVDPTVIPGHSRVYITSHDGSRIVGERSADDTGGLVHGAHIDHFSGAGRAADDAWNAAGRDIHNAKVRFLGY